MVVYLGRGGLVQPPPHGTGERPSRPVCLAQNLLQHKLAAGAHAEDVIFLVRHVDIGVLCPVLLLVRRHLHVACVPPITATTSHYIDRKDALPPLKLQAEEESNAIWGREAVFNGYIVRSRARS